MSRSVIALDYKIITYAQRVFVPTARIAFFVIFFYFGFLKIIGLSPATPLASILTEQTIGLAYFQPVYIGLAVIECIIGILFLIPKATRVVIPLLFIHLLVVSSPLLIVPSAVFVTWLVPNLEGQYILKNVALVAVAIGIAANTMPIGSVNRLRKPKA